MATRVRQRAATPDRWQKALQRAIDGNVQVRQLGTSGQWIATSTSDAGAAHELTVINGVAVGCSCPAGQFDDAVCQHRAMYWHGIGVLDLATPEPVPVIRCSACAGAGKLYQGGDSFPIDCRPCHGAGTVAVRIVVA